MVVLKVGNLLGGEDAAPRQLIERDRGRDRIHIGGQGALVTPGCVVGRHRNRQASNDLAELIFKVLTDKRLADIYLPRVQVLLGLCLEAIRLLRGDHQPSTRRHTLQLLVIPLCRAVEPVEILLKARIMAEDDELKPAGQPVGRAKAQFRPDRVHQAELMSGIET